MNFLGFLHLSWAFRAKWVVGGADLRGICEVVRRGTAGLQCPAVG